MTGDSLAQQIKEEERVYDEITERYIERRLELILQYKGLTGKDYERPLQITCDKPVPRKGTRAERIYRLLVLRGPMQVKDIAEHLEMSRHAVNQVFSLDKPYRKYFDKVTYGVWKAVA